MKKIVAVIFILILFFIFNKAYAQDETITLTTYYPAPYGEYQTLSIGDTYTAPDPGTNTDLVVEGNVIIGSMSPNPIIPEAKLEIFVPEVPELAYAGIALIALPGELVLLYKNDGDPSPYGFNTAGPTWGLENSLYLISREAFDHQALFFGDGDETANDNIFGISTQLGADPWIPRFVVNQNGRVGIGTNDPTGTLHVDGGIAAAGDNGTNTTLLAQNGGTGNTDGGDIILLPGNGSGTGVDGNVVIGPAFAGAPNATLQVNREPPLAFPESAVYIRNDGVDYVHDGLLVNVNSGHGIIVENNGIGLPPTGATAIVGNSNDSNGIFGYTGPSVNWTTPGTIELPAGIQNLGVAAVHATTDVSTRFAVIARQTGADGVAILAEAPAATGWAAEFRGRVRTNVTDPGTDADERRYMYGPAYFDIAEKIHVNDCTYTDVVVIDPDNDVTVTKSSKPYETSVAGVISETPMFYIDDTSMEGGMPLALAGRVPCKATTENGPIKRGDILVTSSKPGYAMKADLDKVKIGMVVGKALEPLEEGEGKVLILVN